MQTAEGRKQEKKKIPKTNTILKQHLKHTLTPPISSTEIESTYPKSSGLGWLSFSWCKNTENIKGQFEKVPINYQVLGTATIATAPVVRQNRRNSNFEEIFRTMSLHARTIKLETLNLLKNL